MGVSGVQKCEEKGELRLVVQLGPTLETSFTRNSFGAFSQFCGEPERFLSRKIS